MNKLSWYQGTNLLTRRLSATKEVAARVALGIVNKRCPSKATNGPEQEVAGVAAEDPVVGPLVVVPVAVPARVGHAVEEVLPSHPSGGSEGRGVDGLVAGEEPGVGVAIISCSHSASPSLRCGDGQGH